MAGTKVKADKKERRKKLSRQEYDKLKQAAWEMVVVQGKDQKEVASILNISEPTVSAWSTENKWRDQREARQQCISTDADNTKKLLSLMSKQRLELETMIHDAIKTGDTKEEERIRRQAAALSDEMSKVNKTLLSLDKKNYTLGVFIDVTDEIFNSLRVYDEELWEKTIDFQSQIIRKKITEIG